MPNTKRPITITMKLGATAVTRAPTRYSKAARINSFLLPLFQIHDSDIIKENLNNTISMSVPHLKELTQKVGNLKSQDRANQGTVQ